jgi:alpha-ketoglutarate-dependent sulfate ester dioxygenase
MSELQKIFVNSADPSIKLDIAPVGGRIGAEVRNFELSDKLTDGQVAEFRKALARHKVLFFRDQHQLNDAAQEAFANRIGKPVAHPTVPVAEGSSYLLELNSQEGYAAASWHTDVTFVEAYPLASVLRAVEIPEAGGDTLWANTATAYAELEEPLKVLVENLRAVHTNAYDYAATFGTLSESNKNRIEYHRSVFASTVYETEHPVVHVHPETGERNLLVGHFVKKFVGLNSTDSQRLFQTLQEHITKPENTVRWRWRAGDVAIWDNRATQHRAIADFGPQHRHLRRVTIAGTAPVAIDGTRSRTLVPAPLQQAAE